MNASTQVSRYQNGFTIIELGITLVVFGLLISVGVPSASIWIRNSQIRAAAESIAQGLSIARTEALRRNKSVDFVLTDTLPDDLTGSFSSNLAKIQPSSSGRSWVVRVAKASGEYASTDFIQSRMAGETSRAVTIEADKNIGTLTFNGLGFSSVSTLGQIKIRPEDAHACIGNGGTVRCLTVEIQRGGSTRICDPTLGADDPRSCQ